MEIVLKISNSSKNTKIDQSLKSTKKRYQKRKKWTNNIKLQNIKIIPQKFQNGPKIKNREKEFKKYQNFKKLPKT